MFPKFNTSLSCLVATILVATFAHSTVLAQSVCLPSPRLLTTVPMGGQVGTELEVVITGQHIEDVEELAFSHPGISARKVLDSNGAPVANRFLVSIAPDCPIGIHEARVLSRLGLSSPRVFTVGEDPEVVQTTASTSVDSAMPLEVNSICNASIPARAVNHYSFVATKGQRIIIDCAAKGIDSKMNPVLVVADAEGRDIKVERRGGALDFTPSVDGTHVVKVHDLTFKGGTEFFYRLAIQEVGPNDPIVRLPSTRAVGTFTWPPTGLPDVANAAEIEPNNGHEEAQRISLPCDLAGSFYPAADVDIFEFEAKSGEEWWVEVASERLGRPTDASVVIQQVIEVDGEETLTDVTELHDIVMPVKRSSNGYSYDGPPYNAGSTDVLGKFEVKADGTYRLQITDLFGGTRNDPRNVYRLVVRKAQPDFALVAWALHMELRNGDRNALSKPLALRGGSTMALEVIAIRRDGFNDEINISMTNLPDGVTATGLKIPAGQNRGILLITAHQEAPRGMKLAEFMGTAVIDEKEVARPCRLATMAWPVGNAWTEIPAPRLLESVPVSVGGSEFASITIAPQEPGHFEAIAGQTLTIPLIQTKRDEFSGEIIGLKTLGSGFEGNAKFEVSVNSDLTEAVVDLAKLNAPPGEYVIAFYGSAVAKYRYNPEAVFAAEREHEAAKQRAAEIAQATAEHVELAANASADEKESAAELAQAWTEKKSAADAEVAATAKRLQDAQKAAQPRDIADIIVSEPISIRIKPADSP